METLEKNIFVKLFANISNTNVIHSLQENSDSFVKKTKENEYLTVCMGILLAILLVIKNILQRRRTKSGYRSYADTLPYVQFIPFLKLPFLDFIILAYRGRKEGIRLVEETVQKLGQRQAKINIGIKNILAISDPCIIQKLLGSSKPGHLEKSEVIYTHALTSLLKDGLLASKVHTWSHHRNTLAPAFKYKALKTYFQLINQEAKQLTQSAISAASKETDEAICNPKMKQLLNHHFIRFVTHVIMGSESVKFSDEQRNSFHQSFVRLRKIAFERMHRPEQAIPFIWWMHPNKKKMDKEIGNIVSISNQIADIYRNKMVNQEIRPIGANCNETGARDYERGKQKEEDELGIKPFECVMEIMIKSGFSNKEISDEVATFLIAGHDTINVAMDLLIIQLAANQEHQKKCRAEVDEIFNSKCKNPLNSLNFQDFSNLKYLEMCILESLRIAPFVFVILRDLQEPLKLDNNYVIPAGELVAVLPWLLHRNPDIYPNPGTYDPDRFLPENVKKRHPYSFIPFSMGVRNCLGWKIALLEMKVMTAWILRHFEMHTTDRPDDVNMLFDVILKLERPYNVTFKKRVLENNLET